MATFFSPITANIEKIQYTPENIPLADFLECCSQVVTFVDVLGPTTFGMVRADMNGNIEKLRNHQASNPTAFHSIQTLIEHEIANKSTKASGSATDALLWLKRALEFIVSLLEEVLTKPDELTTLVPNAYQATLARYHGWMARGVFSMAMRAVPYRKDFDEKLGQNQPPDVLPVHMKQFVDAFKPIVQAINAFYAANNLDDQSTV